MKRLRDLTVTLTGRRKDETRRVDVYSLEDLTENNLVLLMTTCKPRPTQIVCGTRCQPVALRILDNVLSPLYLTMKITVSDVLPPDQWSVV